MDAGGFWEEVCYEETQKLNLSFDLWTILGLRVTPGISVPYCNLK